MNKRILVLVLAMAVVAAFGVMPALSADAQEKSVSLTISANGNEISIPWSDMTLVPVQGTIMNGKGETKEINTEGIALQSVLDMAEAKAQEKVTVIAEDAYQAEVTAEEITEANRVWLTLSDDSLRLIVFGDGDSKRIVKHVVRVVVE